MTNQKQVLKEVENMMKYYNTFAGVEDVELEIKVIYVINEFEEERNVLVELHEDGEEKERFSLSYDFASYAKAYNLAKQVTETLIKKGVNASYNKDVWK